MNELGLNKYAAAELTLHTAVLHSSLQSPEMRIVFHLSSTWPKVFLPVRNSDLHNA